LLAVKETKLLCNHYIHVQKRRGYNVLDAQFGEHLLQLSGASQRARSHHTVVREIGQGLELVTFAHDDGVSDIIPPAGKSFKKQKREKRDALAHGRDHKALRELRGEVLERVNHKVNALVQQRLLQLSREQTLLTNLENSHRLLASTG
jgi:hypothetical protein